jgi:hypothetical protein
VHQLLKDIRQLQTEQTSLRQQAGRQQQRHHGSKAIKEKFSHSAKQRKRELEKLAGELARKTQ